MKVFLERIDRFLGLFERYVTVVEAGLKLDEAEAVRKKEHDETQKLLLSRYAEATENIASTTHAQTSISRGTAAELKRSNDILERRTGDEG